MQVRPLKRYRTDSIDGVSCVIYGDQSYISADENFCLRRQPEGWRIGLRFGPKSVSHVQQQILDTGILRVHFNRRTDAVEALEATVEAIELCS